MQSIQRQYGRVMHKNAEDDAKVTVLINDYNNSDRALGSIIEASKLWRDGWIAALTSQVSMVSAFEEIYQPIVGASADYQPENPREPAITPRDTLDRVANLKQAYIELRTELLEEIKQVDTRIIRPATDAREFIKPLKKTIKNRENKRLDYQTFLDRIEKKRKAQRTDKDEVAIVKMEQDVAKAADEFQYLDNHLRETLPPIITSTFHLLPHLLAALTMTQNTLLAQYYTTLHNYCGDHGIPSPPPPVSDVVSNWEHQFGSIKQDMEHISLIARGNAVHAPLHHDQASGRKGSSMTGFNIRQGLTTRRSNMGLGGSPAPTQHAVSPRPTQGRIPSSGYGGQQGYENQNQNHYSQQQQHEQQAPQFPGPRPTYESTPSQSHQSHSQHLAQPSPSLQSKPSYSSLSNTNTTIKKKPPPPPPAKRLNSSRPEEYVTALYTFEGQEEGDLSFWEGERIKVLKKTGSTDDWWDGELEGGRGKGRFPANYVRLG